jgi:hypothetical protein
MVFLYSVLVSERKLHLPVLGGTFRLRLSTKKVQKMVQILCKPYNPYMTEEQCIAFGFLCIHFWTDI